MQLSIAGAFMADVHDPATRRKNMRAIGSQDTVIEKRVARLLTSMDLTFHVQDNQLAGRPDFVIDQFRCVLFTHGCFWHRHNCRFFRVPATHTEFWLKKIGANIIRDQHNIACLQRDGWRVLVIWECALRGRDKLCDRALCERLDEWLCAGGACATIDTLGIHNSLPGATA